MTLHNIHLKKMKKIVVPRSKTLQLQAKACLLDHQGSTKALIQDRPQLLQTAVSSSNPRSLHLARLQHHLALGLASRLNPQSVNLQHQPPGCQHRLLHPLQGGSLSLHPADLWSRAPNISRIGARRLRLDSLRKFIPTTTTHSMEARARRRSTSREGS